MEDLHTDTLCDYGKNQNQENTDLEPKRDSSDACAGLLNGCDEIDPLDLMDHCDNESIGSNSDVWKGSDSEDENCENKENSTENVEAVNESSDKTENQTSAMEEVERDKPNEAESGDKCDATDEPHVEEQEQTVEDSSVDKPNEVEPSEEKTQEQLPENNGKDTEEVTDGGKDAEKVTDANNITEDSSENKEPVNTDAVEVSTLNGNTNKDTSNDDVVMIPDDTDKDPLSAATVHNDPLGDDSQKNDLPSAEDINTEFTENRLPQRNNEGIDDDVEMEYDADDDDFDPSLLCPEVSMAVDENPVVTTNGPVPHDADIDSPLPYEPVFSTFVDDVTGAEISFNLTSEEQELRKRLYGPTNPIQYTRIHCTACNVHLGSALEGQNNRFVHPMLKVLICKECYHFYTSGEFEKDEDGSELYCRWCGQGGQVLCCSKCEYVFCKRCIRTNFGRKKMFEIRDSDSWDCFRCNTSQIITQRIACYEFFEYVRREISLASTLSGSDIWSKDYSRCCGGRKRAAENGEDVKKPKRKKGGDMDPDYNPLADKPIVVPNPAAVAAASTSSSAPTVLIPINKSVPIPKAIHFVPRYNANKSKDNDIEFVRQIPAPQVTISASRPAYRAILPSHLRPALHPPTLVRISSQPVPPLVSTGNRILGNALQGRNSGANTMMKHEWFEKTVRAAARVNSHLSYTLTQLNKAQSQAASVEELAVVHNKLQEILSSSINSLIQIRKNLRTEFIAGIKTVRLPTKKVDNNDDDVIFVSAPAVMPMPSTSQLKPTVPKDPLIIIDKSNTAPVVDILKSTATTERPRLKVKSVMELQNVPSECITIPDDTPAPTNDTVTKSPVLCNGKNTQTNGDVDPLGDTPVVEVASGSDSSKIETVDLSDEGKSKNVEVVKKVRFENVPRKRRSKNNLVYTLKEQLGTDVTEMKSVKVRLERIDLEELQRKLANEKQ